MSFGVSVTSVCLQGFATSGSAVTGASRPLSHNPPAAKSWLTASLLQQRQQQNPPPEAPTSELRAILQNNITEGSPTTTFLGVSPPVRSGFYGGAANPLSKPDSNNWKLASYSNLQALRELDAVGLSFLSSQLLVGSPKSMTPQSESGGSWCERGIAALAANKASAAAASGGVSKQQQQQQATGISCCRSQQASRASRNQPSSVQHV